LVVVSLPCCQAAVAASAPAPARFAAPPCLAVVGAGKDFAKGAAKIEAPGTMFGDYHLEVKDENGKVVHEQDLPKAVRIWGIFWPPYGIFYNMYRLHDRYIVQSIKSASGETTWLVITPP